MAVAFVFQCVGNVSMASSSTSERSLTSTLQIVGPQVYLAREAPKYHTGKYPHFSVPTARLRFNSHPGLYVDIACWCLLFLLAIGMGAHLKALNRKQEKRRIALGRPGEIKDTSIMSLEEGRAYKEELKQALLAEGKDVADLNADSFDDLTDRENPDFFYVSCKW